MGMRIEWAPVGHRREEDEEDEMRDMRRECV